MEILGIPIQYALMLVPVAVFFGYCFWKLSNDGLERPDPNKQWSPDVDQRKGETLRNHGPAGFER